MATNLPKIAPLLTKGLAKRLEQGKGKVTVMACENAIMGTDILKKAMIETGILTEEQIDEIAVYPNTAVDRMVFGGVHNGKEGIEIGDAFELAIERGKLIDPDSEPIKRLVRDAKEDGRVIDVSCGRRTRAVIITDSEHVILSAIQAETIANRFESNDTVLDDETDDDGEEEA